MLQIVAVPPLEDSRPELLRGPLPFLQGQVPCQIKEIQGRRWREGTSHYSLGWPRQKKLQEASRRGSDRYGGEASENRKKQNEEEGEEEGHGGTRRISEGGGIWRNAATTGQEIQEQREDQEISWTAWWETSHEDKVFFLKNRKTKRLSVSDVPSVPEKW